MLSSIPVSCIGQNWSDTMKIDTIRNNEGKIVELRNWDNLETLSFTYYSSGSLKKEILSTVRNGKQFDFIKEYDSKLKLKFEYSYYVLDRFFYGSVRLDGDYKEYFENGKVKSISHYEMNNLNGETIYYYENGLEEKRIEYLNNRVWNVKSFDKAGNSLEIGDFKNGNGHLRIYQNGILLSTCLYKNGKKVKRSCNC